jgi:ABC-type uncharacterized transport system permease subunit
MTDFIYYSQISIGTYVVAWFLAWVQLGKNQSLWRGGFILMMLMGLAFQTLSVYVRGQTIQHCPMRTLPDLILFVAWSLGLLSFLSGGFLRGIIITLFTAPMLAGLQLVALMMPKGAFEVEKKATTLLLELHAALALMAYAAFAMACVVAWMFLIQEKMLKNHRINGLFYKLPPLNEISKSVQRYVWLGVSILSVSLALSFWIEGQTAWKKLAAVWTVWLMYAWIGYVYRCHGLTPRKIAWLAVLGFLVPLISLGFVRSVN